MTQASLEIGGVSLEKIDETLIENMNILIRRWDRNLNTPEGGPKRASYKNAWNSTGQIAKAYYEMDRVRDMQEKAETAEKEVETEKAEIQKLQNKKKEIETKKASFQKFREMLGQLSFLSKAIKDQEERIAEQKSALKKWPSLNIYIGKAKELQIKKKQVLIHALYIKAQAAQQEYNHKKAEFEKLKQINQADIKQLRNLLLKKQKEESRLAGINLVAKIKQLGSSSIEVKSVSSEKALDLVDGEIKITEAVEITVPGVMEMQLMPQGVNIEHIKFSIRQIESDIKTIYDKYEVSDIDELQALSDAYSEAKQETERLKLILDKILGSNTWAAIKSANDLIPAGIESEDEIKRQIAALCGSKSLDTFIGGLETILNDYKRKYGNINNLQANIHKILKEKEANQAKLASIDEIPKEFQGIDDPNQYDSNLQAEIDNYDSRINDHDTKLRETERNLGEKSSDEYSDEFQEKKAVFESKKAEYEHWLNIYNVFCSLKEHTTGNPVDDIEKNFREYLDIITEGGLTLNSMDTQMAIQLASGTHALTYDILSDGTKDTISLAFRLSMLEHLYPEGNGLAIFDDPFTDMDPKRVSQSCKLIQKFAENNQVLFITCDDKYKKLMPGNIIAVEK